MIHYNLHCRSCLKSSSCLHPSLPWTLLAPHSSLLWSDLALMWHIGGTNRKSVNCPGVFHFNMTNKMSWFDVHLPWHTDGLVRPVWRGCALRWEHFLRFAGLNSSPQMHLMTDGSYQTDCAVSVLLTGVKVTANNSPERERERERGRDGEMENLPADFCRCFKMLKRFYTCYLIYACK